MTRQTPFSEVVASRHENFFMEAPGVGSAGDDDVAPVARAVLCHIHICRCVGLCYFFGLLKNLAVATPPELHLLNHARGPLRWWLVWTHLEVFVPFFVLKEA